jgi:hypothetical protein
MLNVTAPYTGTVTTIGEGSIGLYATGSGSTEEGTVASSISVTNLTISTQNLGDYSIPTYARQGGQITVTGGSATSVGDSSFGAAVVGGGTINLTGTTILTTGDGSAGMIINGAGGVINATDVSITTHGNVDTSLSNYADGAYNGPFGDTYPTGGTLTITNSTITTTGAYASGVVTAGGGTTTTINGSSITTMETDAFGVASFSGGSTSLSGGSVTTSGGGAIGLYASGTGSTIMASGVAVTTSGPDANGVQADTGGAVTLNGGSVTTSGIGSNGLWVGAGSTIAATNVAVTTSGGVDASTGIYSVGVFAWEGGSATFSGGSITTSGASADAVASDGAGSSITLSGGTTILTTGMGSAGLVVVGSGASLTATDVSITTHGNVDSSDGFIAYGAYNGSFSTFPTGGVMTLTDTTITTTGTGAIGVETNSGGVTNISGGAVSTAGQDAHALFVTGAGSTAALSGASTFVTQGNGAIGIYATLGGVVSATGGAVTITTAGGISSATGLGAYGVNADGAGSQINLAAATITTSGAGATALYASDAAGSGAAGSITATGTLTVKTTNAAAVAVGLQGNGASVLATGGGSIVSAGTAIAFMGGTNQIATFDNFSINNQTGDLIFADLSFATINFNNTVANAGTNSLLNATNGSVVTFNASASTLTGAIQTDSTSTTNVNFTNGTTWTMTGSSTVTNLKVTNSAIVFAPPDSGAGFKTLTVTNYVGSGANITLYAALAGANSASDKIIINGGSATGSTLLTIKNVGGVGGATTGAGIPIVVATNGGTVSSNAFSLARHADRRRVQIHARSNQPELVSRVLASRDRRADHRLDQHRRQGAADPDHHQPGAHLDPARRKRADQLLELRLGLRLDRILRGRRARPMGPDRRADADGRPFLQPMERLGRLRHQRANRRRIARL